MKLISYALAASLAAALTGPAIAADITGAGATFPFPVYSKWAEAYKQGDRHRPELPVDRLRRRHPPDQGQDRRFRRDRRAAEGRGPREIRSRPVPDRARRRRAGREHPGPEARRAQAHRRHHRRHLPRPGQEVERSAHRADQPGRDPARRQHHPGLPLGRLGHDQHLHRLPLERLARVEVVARHGHDRELAGRPGRQGQRGRRRDREAGRELDRLCRVRLRQAEQACPSRR